MLPLPLKTCNHPESAGPLALQGENVSVRWIEFVPGLQAAIASGAFRTVECCAEDLGISLEVAWILTDSIRTMVAVRLQGAESELQVSRAWLTDDRGGALPLLDVLELSPEGAARAGHPLHRDLLVFGGLPPEVGRLRLEVQRVEVPVPGLAVCSSLLDPWQHLDEDLALRVMAWEKPDDPMSPVPVGTAEGCWALEIEHSSRSAWEASSAIDLDLPHPLGTARLHLLRLEGGLTGWRLSSRIETGVDPPPWSEQMDWLRQAARPEDVRRRLEEEGLTLLQDAPSLRLSLKAGGQPIRCERRSGPWGPLQDRFYDFFPPTTAPPESLLADQILGVPLAEPWVYEFHPKKVDDPRARVTCPHLPFKFQAEVWVEPLYWQEEFMLLAPRVSVLPGPVSEAWAARCRICDLEGNTYDCQGQAWAALPGGGGNLYGLQFPPLHRLMDRARLEVDSVDLLLSTPFEVCCPEMPGSSPAD